MDSLTSHLVQFRCAIGGDGAKIRSAKYNGTDYVVAPVVIFIADTVIHPVNAAEPELVTARALRVAPGGWNSRPIIMDHPHNGDDYTSANDPEILEQLQFGTIFHAKYHNNRVIADAYLDPARAKVVGPDAVDVIERLRSGKMVETSGCAYTVARLESGTHSSGKRYGAVWVEITPDHLAMLPRGTEGACSVDMGCGMPRAARANNHDQTKGAHTVASTVKANKDKIKGAVARFTSQVSRLSAAGTDSQGQEDAEKIQYETISKMLDAASASLESARTLAASLIAMGDGAEEEVEDACLESIRAMCMQATGDLYAVSSACWDALDDNSVGEGGEVVPVVIVGDTRYNAGARHNSTDQKNVQQVHDMSVKLGADCAPAKASSAATAATTTAKPCGCKDNAAQPTEGAITMSNAKSDLIGQLIASKDHPSPFTEDDRKTLEGFSEEKLTALAATVKASVAAVQVKDKTPEPVAVVTPAAAASAPTTPKTPDEIETEFLARADVPQSVKDAMQERKLAVAAKRAQLVSGILKASSGIYTKERLESKPTEDLEELARFAKVAMPKDFSGAGGVFPDKLDEKPAIRVPPDSLEDGRKLRAARQAAMSGKAN